MASYNKVIEWFHSGNSAAFDGFCKLLVSLLISCFEQTSGKAPFLDKEKVWSKFHTVRNSPSLKHVWVSTFEAVVKTQLDPIFYQFTTQAGNGRPAQDTLPDSCFRQPYCEYTNSHTRGGECSTLRSRLYPICTAT